MMRAPDACGAARPPGSPLTTRTDFTSPCRPVASGSARRRRSRIELPRFSSGRLQFVCCPVPAYSRDVGLDPVLPVFRAMSVSDQGSVTAEQWDTDDRRRGCDNCRDQPGEPCFPDVPENDLIQRAREFPAMKPFCTAAVLIMLLPGVAFARAECSQWNTETFFEAASADDVRACLDAGADVAARDEDGLTPLHLAARDGTPEVVTALLDAGADIGANPNEWPAHGLTPLHLAAGGGTPGVVAVLLDAGADIRARSGYGWTPLHVAAGGGTPEIVTALLDAGADIAVRANDGWTSLHWAARYGTPEAVTVLLDAGADIEARDDRGWTPLHVAARDGTPEVVTALLNSGANIGARTGAGATPLDLAKHNKKLAGTKAYRWLNDAQLK